ncbi:putative poly-ribose polymerase [Usnea florida]
MAYGIFRRLTSAFKAQIGALIKTYGGVHVTKIPQEQDKAPVTHLVTTAKHIEANASKVQEASKFPDIKLVSFDWLTASIDTQTRADEAQFSFSQLNSSHDVATDSVGSALSKQKDTKGKGKKRPRSPVPMEEESSDAKDLPEASPIKKHREVQRAKSGSLLIPVDETCPLTGTHRVYIGGDGMIYDAALNQTNAGANNNKFYRVQILVSGAGDYQTWTRWGRVGELGKGTTLGDGSLTSAMSFFEKKFKDKAGVSWSNRFDAPTGSRQKGYYTFIERKYEDDSDDDAEKLPTASASGPSKNKDATSPVKRADSALPKSVQRLMQLIFNQQYFADTMRELDYDAEKLPLGKLSKRTLERGYEILKDLSELLTDPAIADNKHNMTWPDAIAACSDAFYTVIPHSFGRSRPPVISSDEKLKKEINLMESLSDMQIASTIMKDTGGDAAVNELDRQFSGLGLQEMTPLDMDSDEFKLLQEYLIKSHGHTHHLSFKVQDIFRIERTGEKSRFEQIPYAKLKGSDRRLLWHGSRVTNYGGILSQGLRIAPPEAPVNGYAFGKGVYLADISSKSANYCQAHASSNTGLLLLCEAELGRPTLSLTVGRTDAAEMAKQHGCIATFGKGATVPMGWKDAGCVNADLAGVAMPDTTMEPGPANHAYSYLQYNEYIAYDVAQVKLRYLLRVEMVAGGFGY